MRRYLARSWAQDLRGTGIRINVLVPGPTATEALIDGFAQTGMSDAIIAGLIQGTPIGRLGDPAETGAVAAFLASDDSSFMTGSEIFVDGGHAQI